MNMTYSILHHVFFSLDGNKLFPIIFFSLIYGAIGMASYEIAGEKEYIERTISFSCKSEPVKVEGDKYECKTITSRPKF